MNGQLSLWSPFVPPQAGQTDSLITFMAVTRDPSLSKAEAEFLVVFGHSDGEHVSVVDAHVVTTALVRMYVRSSRGVVDPAAG